MENKWKITGSRIYKKLGEKISINKTISIMKAVHTAKISEKEFLEIEKKFQSLYPTNLPIGIPTLISTDEPQEKITELTIEIAKTVKSDIRIESGNYIPDDIRYKMDEAQRYYNNGHKDIAESIKQDIVKQGYPLVFIN